MSKKSRVRNDGIFRTLENIQSFKYYSFYIYYIYGVSRTSIFMQSNNYMIHCFASYLNVFPISTEIKLTVIHIVTTIVTTKKIWLY